MAQILNTEICGHAGNATYCRVDQGCLAVAEMVVAAAAGVVGVRAVAVEAEPGSMICRI